MNPFKVIERYCQSDPFLMAMMRGLLGVYDYKWRRATSDLEVLHIEKTFWSPLYNLDTNRRSRKFVLAGKIDKVVKDGNSVVIYDHKTTSSQIGSDSAYWRTLQIEGQPRQYELLLRANGIKVDRVVWDVVRKPNIRPKKLTKAAHGSVLASGKYFGWAMSNETLSELANGMDRENPEMFEVRVYETVAEDTSEYLSRKSIPNMREDLYRHNQNMWDMAADVVESRRRHEKSGRVSYNPGACLQWGTPCRYLGICEGTDRPDSGNWREGPVHPELDVEEIETDKEILTNSRLKCFQSCRKKHHFKYDMALERNDDAEKESEALYFGTVWHHVMDAWWADISGFEPEGEESYGNLNEMA